MASIQNDVMTLPDMVCTKCNTILSHGVTIQNPKSGFNKNDIVVCSVCATISRVGDGGLVKMERGDVEKLDAQSKMNLAAAVTSVRAHQDGSKDIVSVNGVR